MRRFLSIFAVAMLCLLSGIDAFAAPPSVGARYLAFSGVTSSQMNLSWINGNGSQRLVLVSADPLFDFTAAALRTSLSNSAAITVDGTMANADAVSDGAAHNGYVIARTAGNARTAVISGLNAGTTYQFYVLEFNGTNPAEYCTITPLASNPRAKATLSLTAPVALAPSVLGPWATLSWTPGGGSDDFTEWDIVIDDNADFTSPLADYDVLDIGTLDAGTPESYMAYLPAGTYYWKVRARSGASLSNWTAGNSFTVAALAPPEFTTDAISFNETNYTATVVFSKAVTNKPTGVYTDAADDLVAADFAIYEENGALCTDKSIRSVTRTAADTYVIGIIFHSRVPNTETFKIGPADPGSIYGVGDGLAMNVDMASTGYVNQFSGIVSLTNKVSVVNITFGIDRAYFKIADALADGGNGIIELILENNTVYNEDISFTGPCTALLIYDEGGDPSTNATILGSLSITGYTDYLKIIGLNFETGSTNNYAIALPNTVAANNVYIYDNIITAAAGKAGIVVIPNGTSGSLIGSVKIGLDDLDVAGANTFAGAGNAIAVDGMVNTYTGVTGTIAINNNIFNNTGLAIDMNPTALASGSVLCPIIDLAPANTFHADNDGFESGYYHDGTLPADRTFVNATWLAPGPVLVSDDATGDDADEVYNNIVNGYAAITDASTDNLLIMDGTYTENLTIDKDLTHSIIGKSHNAVINNSTWTITGTAANTTTIDLLKFNIDEPTPTSQFGIKIAAVPATSTVTIQNCDFEFKGVGESYAIENSADLNILGTLNISTNIFGANVNGTPNQRYTYGIALGWNNQFAIGAGGVVNINSGNMFQFNQDPAYTEEYGTVGIYVTSVNNTLAASAGTLNIQDNIFQAASDVTALPDVWNGVGKAILIEDWNATAATNNFSTGSITIDNNTFDHVGYSIYIWDNATTGNVASTLPATIDLYSTVANSSFDASDIYGAAWLELTSITAVLYPSVQAAENATTAGLPVVHVGEGTYAENVTVDNLSELTTFTGHGTTCELEATKTLALAKDITAISGFTATTVSLTDASAKVDDAVAAVKDLTGTIRLDVAGINGSATVDKDIIITDNGGTLATGDLFLTLTKGGITVTGVDFTNTTATPSITIAPTAELATSIAISTNTFDFNDADEAQVAVKIDRNAFKTAGVQISNNTFTMDGYSGSLAPTSADYAILVEASNDTEAGNGPLWISGNTFNNDVAVNSTIAVGLLNSTNGAYANFGSMKIVDGNIFQNQGYSIYSVNENSICSKLPATIDLYDGSANTFTTGANDLVADHYRGFNFVSDLTANTAVLTPSCALPAPVEISALAADGGRVVTGYFNASNTGVTVTYSLPTDISLVGGNIQLQIDNDGNGTWADVLGTGIDPIASTPLTAKTYTVSTADLVAAGDYSDNSSVDFRLKVTSFAGNSAIGGTYAEPLFIDFSVPNATMVSATADNVINIAEKTAGFTVVAKNSEANGTLYVWDFTTNGAVNNSTDFAANSLASAAGNPIPANNTNVLVSANNAGVIDGAVYHVYAMDAAGNVSAAAAATFTADLTAPGVPVVTSVATDNKVNNAEKAAVTSVFTHDGTGTTYTYTYSDGVLAVPAIPVPAALGASPVTIPATDLTTLADGPITLTVTVIDNHGNPTSSVAYPASKDVVAPAGYTVSIDQPAFNASNYTATSFTFANAEVGATYNYTFTGVGTVTGSGTILTATDNIAGINQTPLTDGAVTLSVTLTDPAGNVGVAETDNVVKDIVAPAAFTTGVATTTGGNVVANYWNASNTGLSVVVPLAADATLDNGTVQLQINKAGAGYENLFAAHTITNAERLAGSVTITGAFDDAGLVDGNTLAFNAIITDASGNATTGTASATTITVDQTAPTAVLTSATADKVINIAEKAAGFDVVANNSEANGNLYVMNTLAAQATVANLVANNIATLAGNATGGTDVNIPIGAAAATILDNNTYNVYAVDVAGNMSAASAATFTVDLVAPTIANLVYAPNSVSQNGLKGIDQNNKVNTQVVFTENIVVTGTPRLLTNAGVSAYFMYSSIWSATSMYMTYTVVEGENTAANAFTLSGADVDLNGGSITDNAGNPAVLTLPVGAVAAYTAATDITIDGTRPTYEVLYHINGVTGPALSGANPAIGIGNNYYIEITASEELSSTLPEVAITGTTNNNVPRPNATNTTATLHNAALYKYSFQRITELSLVDDGVSEIINITARDLAGNLGYTVPTNAWCGAGVCASTGTNVAANGYQAKIDAVSPTPEVLFTAAIDYNDGTNNWTKDISIATVIDYGEPTQNVTNGIVTVVNGTKAGFTNVGGTSIQFSLNVTPTTDGAVTVSVPQGNNTNNIQDWAFNYATAGSGTIFYDGTLPTVTDNVDGNWHNSNYTITFTANDGAGSGIASVKYTTDGTDPKTSGTAVAVNAAPYTCTIAADGQFTIKYYAIDNVGNESAVATAVNLAKVDKTQPVATAPVVVDPAAGVYWNDGAKTITWNAANFSDATSGLNANSVLLQYTTDGGLNFVTIATGENNDGTYSWNVPSGLNSTNVQVYVQISDNATNSIGALSGVFTIDDVEPTVKSIVVTPVNNTPINGYVVNEATTSITVAANFSETMKAGVAPTITLSADLLAILTQTGATWTDWDTYTWTYTVADLDVSNILNSITITDAQDLAGNISVTYTLENIKVDQVTPTAVVANGKAVYNKADGGTTTTFAVTFNEAMEPTAVPSIDYNGTDLSAVFNAGTGAWSVDNTIYTYTRNVTDNGLLESFNNNSRYMDATATDLAGNPAVAVNSAATFNVDMKAPVITYRDAYQSGTFNTNTGDIFAKVGDRVYFEFTSSEALQAVDGIAGDIAQMHTTTVIGFENSLWPAPYVDGTSVFAFFGSPDATYPEGFMSFKTKLRDLSGNPSNELTQTTDVTFDMTAPTIVSITRETPTNGDLANFYTNDDILGFAVKFSEEVVNLDATDLTPNATNVTSIGAGDPAGTIVLAAANAPAGDLTQTYDFDITGVTGNGTYGIIVNNAAFTDRAGNAMVLATVNSPLFTIDNTEPTISALDIACNNNSATITFSEGVYTAPVVTGGGLSAADMSIANIGTGATFNSFTLPSHVAGATAANITLSWTGMIGGYENLQVNPATGTSIYDRAGNAMLIGQNKTDFANPAAAFINEPESIAVCPGATATFSFSATGSQGLNKQWQVSTNGGTDWSDIAGQTGLTYTTPAADYATMNNNRYRVHIWDACYDRTSNQFIPAVLTVNQPATIVVAPANTDICQNTATTLSVTAGGTAPLTYQWQYKFGGGAWADVVNGNPVNAVYTNATTPTLGISGITVPSLSYEYRVVVSDGCGGSVPSALCTLSVYAAPIADMPANTSVCATETSFEFIPNVQNDANVLITTNGDGTFDYSGANPVYTYGVADKANGSVTLTLTVDGFAGCGTATDFTTITFVPAPTAEAGIAQTLCATSNTATMAATAANGTIAWSVVSGTGTFVDGTLEDAVYNISAADKAAGTVTLRMTVDNASCDAVSDDVVITINPDVVAGTATAVATPLCYGSNTDINLVGNVGTIQWQSSTNGVDFTNVGGATTATLNTGVLTSTTYYRATVTSGVCGSVNSNIVTVTVNPTSVAGTISGVNSICSGSATTLTLTGAVGTIQWQSRTGVNPFADIVGQTTATLATGNLATTTDYQAVVTSSPCATATTASYTVTVNATTNAPTVSGTTTICNNTTTALTATSTNGTTYRWYDAAVVGNLLYTGATFTTPALTSNTSYWVEAEGLCAASTRTQVTVTVIPDPVLSVHNPLTVCAPNTVDLTLAAVTLGSTNVTELTYWTNPGATTALANPSAVSVSGTYYIKAVNGACGIDIEPVVVTIDPATAPTITGDVQAVLNSDITLTTAAGMTNYVWNVDGGTITNGTGTNTIAVNWALLGNKNVTVTYTNAGGCNVTSAAHVVNVIAGCVAVTTAQVTPATSDVCSGDNLTLTATTNGTTPITYAWYHNGILDPTATSSTLTFTVDPSTVGTYYVIASNTCTTTPVQSASVAVTIKAIPTQPLITAGATAVCAGETSKTYTVTNTVGVTYTWTYSGSGVAPIADTDNSITIDFANNATSGTLTVTPSNGCVNGTPATWNVTVNPLPDNPGIITGTATVCEGSTSVTYSVTNVAGVTYHWDYSGNGETIHGSGNEVTVDFAMGSTTGLMTVTPENACGFGPSVSLPVTITTVPSQPSVITGLAQVASGATQTYSVDNVAGVTYTWAYSGTNASLTPTGNTVSIAFASNATSGVLTVTPSNVCGNGTARTLPIVITAPEPSAAQCATNLVITGVTRNTVSLSWTAGAVGTRVVILASTAAFATTPTDFVSNYTANASYTLASDLNGGVATPRVVYDGNATAMTVSGLAANTLHYFKVFTYFADANNNYTSRNYNTTNVLSTYTRTSRKEGETDNSNLTTEGFKVSSVTPNPVTTEMNFNIDAYEAGRFEVELYEATGRVVYTRSLDLNAGQNSVSLPIITTGKLAAGKYNLRVRSGSGYVDQQVIVMP